ncbi:MAG TPA: hypothetical protein VJ779_11010 [Acetobacteraceae bacterium]|nr:hypothetical protein [Acetobacteraceae bacterium]
MSDLILAGPTELTAAELDMVAAAGPHLPNVSVNVEINNNVGVQTAIGLNVLSPGAIAAATNFNFTFQQNRIA